MLPAESILWLSLLRRWEPAVVPHYFEIRGHNFMCLLLSLFLSHAAGILEMKPGKRKEVGRRALQNEKNV